MGCVHIQRRKGKDVEGTLFGALVDSPFSFLSADVKDLSQRRLAGMLCYSGLFVTGLLFYAFEERNSFVRFRASPFLSSFP